MRDLQIDRHRLAIASIILTSKRVVLGSSRAIFGGGRLFIWTDKTEAPHKCQMHNKSKPSPLTSSRVKWHATHKFKPCLLPLLPPLLSTGGNTFQETGEGISLSSSTTDNHRHIKTSMLKSGNGPSYSRQTPM